METETTPPDSSSPNDFLNEIKSLRSFLITSNLRESSIIKSCFEEAQKIINICTHPGAIDSPFIWVVIYEFSIFSKSIMEDLKLKSGNYKKTLDDRILLEKSESLLESFKKNIFLKYETKNIELCHNSLSQNKFDSLKSYMNISEHLKNYPQVIAIKRELAVLRSQSDDETSYYASIIGPSFMGKTQTAFTLSHKMVVFYVNLLSTFNTGDVKMQPIYRETSKFSDLFLWTIKTDMELVEKEKCEFNAHDLLKFRKAFETLGLLYVLIVDHKLNPNLSAEERFIKWCQLSHVIIPKLTVREFRQKLQKLRLNLDDYLVFIDEIPLAKTDKHHIIPMIKFLRNLIRAAKMISLLCGTNSHANNLIGESGTEFSGNHDGMKRWVKVLTELIRANIRSLCCNISFTSKDGKTMKNASDFILDVNEKSTLDYEALFDYIFGNDFRNINHIEDAKTLLQFIFKIVDTTLPGIASAAAKFIFDSIKAVKTGPNSLNSLWKKLNAFIIKTVINRKPRILSLEGLIASLHIITFPSQYKDESQTGHAAADKVNGHYFYYGVPGEKCFDLDIGPELNFMINDSVLLNFSNSEDENNIEITNDQNLKAFSRKLYKNNSFFIENCHFPSVYEDTLLCLSLWNLWHLIKISQKPTLAFLFDYHLKKTINFAVNSAQILPDSFSLELLAQWSICYASHGNIDGSVDGLKLLNLFTLNIQSLNEPNLLEKLNVSLNTLQLPESLSKFLSDLKIPYLINGPPKKSLNESGCGLENVPVNKNLKLPKSNNEKQKLAESYEMESKNISELSTDLASFVKFGTCHRPLNTAGWDVLFDIRVNGVEDTGYIECKLWSTPIGLDKIFPYYKKASINGIKFTILVSRKFQASTFENKTEENDAKKVKVEANEVITAQGTETKPSKTPSIDYVKEIEKLAKDSLSRLNLYCIRPVRKISRKSKSLLLTGKVEIETLKEFSNPTGVFLLIESNFNPPHRSSKAIHNKTE